MARCQPARKAFDWPPNVRPVVLATVERVCPCTWTVQTHWVKCANRDWMDTQCKACGRGSLYANK